MLYSFKTYSVVLLKSPSPGTARHTCRQTQNDRHRDDQTHKHKLPSSWDPHKHLHSTSLGMEEEKCSPPLQNNNSDDNKIHNTSVSQPGWHGTQGCHGPAVGVPQLDIFGQSFLLKKVTTTDFYHYLHRSYSYFLNLKLCRNSCKPSVNTRNVACHSHKELSGRNMNEMKSRCCWLNDF